jgi:hypothetical protein
VGPGEGKKCKRLGVVSIVSFKGKGAADSFSPCAEGLLWSRRLCELALSLCQSVS